VDHLQRKFTDDDIAVAHIYCSYQEREEQTAANLVGSLVQQLVQQCRIIPDKVTALYKRHLRTQTRPSLREFSDLLQLLAPRFSLVVVIIDALDESPESTRENLVAEILKLQPLSLMVTSRRISSIDLEFEQACHLEIRATHEDVRKYIEGRIKDSGRLKRHLQADPDLQKTIVDTVVNKVKGM
jgi:ankyrin repeat domain-containing protein 50